MPTIRDSGGGAVASSRRSRRQNQQERHHNHHHPASRATTVPPSSSIMKKGSGTTMMISSPDKTEASTPPSSPEANYTDSNNNMENSNHQRDSSIGKRQEADWGVGPDDEENDHPENSISREKQQQHAQQQQQGNNSNNGNALQGKFLSVDKILCRAPSHDSNISDLSASLSPHPAFASGNNRWGEMLRRGKSLESGTESEAEREGNNRNNGRTELGGNSHDNIVLKVLNECGVLENMNDLFRLTNKHDHHHHHFNDYTDEEDDEDIIPPPPPPPSHPPNARTSASPTTTTPQPPQKLQQDKNNKSGGLCYDVPAVWGVAPNHDDDNDLKKAKKDASTKTRSQVEAKEEEADGEQYDIVELVLDEAHLRGTSSSTYSHKGVATKKTEAATAIVGAAPSPAKGVGGTSAGGKSPVVIKGILKNKLSSMKLSSNKTSAATSDDAASPPRRMVAMSGTIGGMAVLDASGKSSTAKSPREGGGGAAVAASSSSSPVPSPVDKHSILTASQHKKLTSVIKKSSSSSSSTGGSVVDSDPPGIIAENGLAEHSPQPVRELTSLDKVDRAMMVALTMSSSDELRSTSNGHYGDVEVNDDLLVKDKNDDDAEVNKNKKTKKKKRGNAKMLGGFSFHKSKSSSIPEAKKDPPTSSSSMNTEDEKSYSVDAATTAATNTRSNASSSLFRSRSKKKGLDAEAEPPPSYAATDVPVNKNVTLTPQASEDAKKWKAIFDTASNKHYYYHKVTKEVRWEKPPGYDEARSAMVKEAEGSAPHKKSIGFMGRGKSVRAGAKENKKTSSSGSNKSGRVNNEDGLKDRTIKKDERGNVNFSEDARYWRATIDNSTNKTYYYNKKTREVTWRKPACLVVGNEGEDGGVGKKVVETTAVSSVAQMRKKSWFKRGGSSSNDNTIDDIQENGDVAKASDASKKDELSSENPHAAVNDSSKYWRSASDASTGKTYYFNKKTKLVSWTKPEGFVERESSKNEINEKEASSELAAAAVDSASEKVEETAVMEEELNQAVEPSDAGGNTSTLSQPSTDNFSEIESFHGAEAIDTQVDETMQFVKEDAPFDEPFDCVQSSPRRAHFEPKTQPKTDVKAEEDNDEQHDAFNENDNFAAGNSLNRRAKSLKSTISIDRQRTFASQTTETTRKAANTHNHLSSSGINQALSGTTHEESLNNSSIASEIFFADEEPIESLNNHQVRDHDQREVRQTKNAPAPLSSRIAQSIRNMSHHNDGNNRRYLGKRAENLGDCSIESIEEVDEEDGRYLNVDDEVSALSGIGNESIGKKKNKRGQSVKEESPVRHCATQKLPRSDNIKDWTQEELDLFISKNDWGSVAEYINEMRVNKEAGSSRRNNHVAQHQSSGGEVQERTDYKRILDGEEPGSKFGASSQKEFDEISQDSHSAGESESLWQSLSSASYESEPSQFR